MSRKVVAEQLASCCPKCGSSRREPYSNRREMASGGQFNDHVYTHVVWQNTRCRDCGQARVDKTRICRPADPIAKR